MLPASSQSTAVDNSTARATVAAGAIVSQPLQFERGSFKYVGGIASGLVPASPDRVLQAFSDPNALARMLPKTKQVTFLDHEADGDRVELRQGNSFIEAKYTVSIQPSNVPGELRFALDRSRHHDIDDVYGYFKVERFDATRSVVTVAAAVDVGSDITQMLLGRRVQDAILSTPSLMRDYFAHTAAPAIDPVFASNDPR
jgi:carbon monoxide dehydrogenase subunit G